MEVIVFGGGVLKRKILIPKIRENVKKLLAGYVQVPKLTSKYNNIKADCFF